jgi:hypothetical protein
LAFAGVLVFPDFPFWMPYKPKSKGRTVMKSYRTLSQAMEDLKKQGYTEDFNLSENALNWPARKLQIHPEDFVVDETYRFEGMSSTDDNSILYAISSNNGVKGLLVDAYGVYSESLSPAMIQKLRVTHQDSEKH